MRKGNSIEIPARFDILLVRGPMQILNRAEQMSQKTSKTLHKWVELFPDCSLHVRSLGAQTPAVDMIIPRTFGYCLVRLHLFRCAPIARPVTQILFAIGYQVQIRGKVSPIWQLRHHT